jgi:hypothetical protein
MRPIAIYLLLPASLMACAPAPHHAPKPPPVADRNDTLEWGTLGKTIGVGGPKVTPLTLLEDSRCPAGVRCVWAGRVRLSVRVDLGRGSMIKELTLGEPIWVADGTLELADVQPGKSSEGPAKSEYRFGFRFMGGL